MTHDTPSDQPVTLDSRHGDLYVADPRTEVVPRGWAEQVAKPAIAGIDMWSDLDEIEARIKAAVEYAEALFGKGQSVYEYRAAWILVKIRRGKLLGPLAGHGGDRRSPAFQPPTLAVVPESPPESTAIRLRKLAEHAELIERHIFSTDQPGQVTETQCLNIIREHTPAKPDADLPDAEPADAADNGQVRLLHGDFRDRLGGLEPGSVDLIVTDPPYEKDELPLWSDLAVWAAKLLGPRGLLFAWSGQMYLPQILARLGEHLTYGWTFGLHLPGSGSRIMGRHIIQGWKPVLAFSQGTWPSGQWGDDVLVSPERDKTDYAWQQNMAPAQRVIERYSPPTGLVVDPFLGVGSFGVAAKAAGRRFVGVELDADRFRRAQVLVLDP